MSHRSYIERETEAQSHTEGDSADEDENVGGWEAIEDVGGGIAAEAEVSTNSIDAVENDDDDVGVDHNGRGSLGIGVLQLIDDREELNLAAATKAEERKGVEDVHREDEALNLKSHQGLSLNTSSLLGSGTQPGHWEVQFHKPSYSARYSEDSMTHFPFWQV